LLSTCVLINHTFLNIFLDYGKTWEEALEEPNDKEVYYKEPNLSGGIEGEDYNIFFGAEDEDIEGEA
jgi:hypothetical protein